MTKESLAIGREEDISIIFQESSSKFKTITLEYLTE
jgi:hypothetical protein